MEKIIRVRLKVFFRVKESKCWCDVNIHSSSHSRFTYAIRKHSTQPWFIDWNEEAIDSVLSSARQDLEDH